MSENVDYANKDYYMGLLNYTFSIDAWKEDEHHYLFINNDDKTNEGQVFIGYENSIGKELDNDSFFEMMDLYSYAKDFKENLLLYEERGEGKEFIGFLLKKIPFLKDFKEAITKYSMDKNYGEEMDSGSNKAPGEAA